MFHSLLAKFEKQLNIASASAHCDIPCGIYDPSTAIIATLTVIRCMDLIAELEGENLSLAQQARLSRLIAQKEEHAEKAKQEVRIIWGDFFKQPQFEKHPNIHEVTHNIMLAGSKCRQEIAQSHGDELLKLVNQFAEIFWDTKGVETYRAVCPYAPSKEVVYPKIG